jgi:hypothetical protein
MIVGVIALAVGLLVGALLPRTGQERDAYWVAVGTIADLVAIRNTQLENAVVLAKLDNAIDLNLVWARKFGASSATANDENARKILVALDRSWSKQVPSTAVRPTSEPAAKDWDEMRQQNVAFVRRIVQSGSVDPANPPKK